MQKSILSLIFVIALLSSVIAANPPLIDATAKVHSTAQIGLDSVISANVVIKENVIIGANSFIGPGTVIREKVSLGDNANVGANNDIKSSTRAGLSLSTERDVTVRESVTIGNYVSIGSNSNIRGGATIGDYAVLGDNVTVFENINVLPGITVPNDETLEIDNQKFFCPANPFVAQSFEEIPYKNSCELLQNNDKVVKLVESWKTAAKGCYLQLSDIVSELGDAVEETKEFVATDYVYLGEETYCIQSFKFFSPPAHQLAGSDPSLLDILKTCLKYTQNVCDKTNELWTEYADYCGKLEKGEVCGAKYSAPTTLDGIYNTTNLQAANIKSKFYPNAIKTCNNFLYYFGKATSCDQVKGNGNLKPLGPGEIGRGIGQEKIKPVQERRVR